MIGWTQLNNSYNNNNYSNDYFYGFTSGENVNEDLIVTHVGLYFLDHRPQLELASSSGSS